MLINQARFKQNQGAGYVLKPEFLREDALRNNNFDINDTSTFPRSQPFSYKIKVGYSVESPFNPYSRSSQAASCQSRSSPTKERWSIRTLKSASLVLQSTTIRRTQGRPNSSTTTASGDNESIVPFWRCFSPCWNEEFTLTTWFPELSMLEILVYDKDVGTKVRHL